MNLIYFLADESTICDTIIPVTTLIGIVIKILQIAVPIILIIMGTVKLSTAVASQDDKVIKEAQSGLIKKVIVAICVFLVIPLVTGIMSLIGGSADACMECINDPFNGVTTTNKKCEVIKSSSTTTTP